jgi:hypothetical protein
LIGFDVYLLRDDALQPQRLTVRRGNGGMEGARNGKGNQDIEVCKKNLPFSIADWTGKDNAFYGVRLSVGWVGKVQDCTRKG